MKKIYFAIIALVVIVSVVSTILVMNVIDSHSKDILNFSENVIYSVTAKEEYESALNMMDNVAYASNFTGVKSVTNHVGEDDIVFSACYVNGERVSSTYYNEWIYNITNEYANELNDAQTTIEEQSDRLNNITIGDWLNCKFGSDIEVEYGPVEFVD